MFYILSCHLDTTYNNNNDKKTTIMMMLMMTDNINEDNVMNEQTIQKNEYN